MRRRRRSLPLRSGVPVVALARRARSGLGGGGHGGPMAGILILCETKPDVVVRIFVGCKRGQSVEWKTGAPPSQYQRNPSFNVRFSFVPDLDRGRWRSFQIGLGESSGEHRPGRRSFPLLGTGDRCGGGGTVYSVYSARVARQRIELVQSVPGTPGSPGRWV